MSNSHDVGTVYSQTCIKRSPLRQKKVTFIRQVNTYNKFNSYEIFFEMTRKRWSLNTGDCLIKVTLWAGLTVHSV